MIFRGYLAIDLRGIVGCEHDCETGLVQHRERFSGPGNNGVAAVDDTIEIADQIPGRDYPAGHGARTVARSKKPSTVRTRSWNVRPRDSTLTRSFLPWNIPRNSGNSMSSSYQPTP